MSTRSAIITKTESGYSGIYCHYDGYETGVGATLLKHYRDPAKVASLIALGDISQLGARVEPTGEHSFAKPEIGVTVAYMRDRGEKDCEANTGATASEVSRKIENNGYVYVFEDGKWTVNGEDLTKAVKHAEKAS